MAQILNKAVYYALAAVTKVLLRVGVRSKNSAIFQLKRKYLLRVIPSTKLLAEIAGVSHVLYHPRPEADYMSINNHLKELLAEYHRRKLPHREIIAWAEACLSKGPTAAKELPEGAWKPDMTRLKEFTALCKERTTTRHVHHSSFDKTLIHHLIECAVEAPSSCNKQGWRFIIFDDPKTIARISEIKRQPFLATFPYIIACCFDRDSYQGLDQEMTPYLDCGGALMNLCNAATALGLASCWCNFAIKNSGNASHKKFRVLAGLPDNIMPVSFVALGKPQKIFIKPPRESLKFYLPYEKNVHE